MGMSVNQGYERVGNERVEVGNESVRWGMRG